MWIIVQQSSYEKNCGCKCVNYFHNGSLISTDPLPTKHSCDGLLQFTCDNGMCLDNSKMCDGINDCGDDSDEMNCSKL